MAALHKRAMYARDSALIATPIGGIRIRGDEDSIESIRIESGPPPRRSAMGTARAVRTAADQIEAWFAGRLARFDLPLAPAATPRGAALRAGMSAIPYGDTISYGALAVTLGSGARAIGQACARNPFPIVVPCHRVVNARGTPGAYSAGAGPATKTWLLEHERRYSQG